MGAGTSSPDKTSDCWSMGSVGCSQCSRPHVVQVAACCASRDEKKEIDVEDLFQLLQAVEGDQSAQDALFKRLQTQGACMIVTVDVEESDNLRMLRILQYLRAMFAILIWNDEVRLVKADANRFFIFATSSGKACRAAWSMKLLVSEFGSWLGNVCPELGPLSSPARMKAGIHDGGLLLIEGDCFGDPVNVASKLGEDIAEWDHIMVSASSTENESDDHMKALKSQCTLKPLKTTISGLTLDHCLMEVTDINNAFAPMSLPNKKEVDAYLSHIGHSSAIKTQDLTIMVTDMSGFTRLTKTYGILHFLRLVFATRFIMLPAMEKLGGWKIKYEGDNVIAAFPGPHVAVSCIKSCEAEFAKYNQNRKKDFQIHIGFGLDVGVVKTLGHDIVGAAFDCSFKLAEDMSEDGEVLITERIRSIVWPSLQNTAKLSAQKEVEVGPSPKEKYYVLKFA